MTAFQPLLSKTFHRTILRSSSSKEYIGILSTPTNRNMGQNRNILYDTYSRIFSYRMVEPTTDLNLERGVILTVVNTQSSLIRVGEFLRVIDITQSSVVGVSDIVGSNILLGIDITQFADNGF